MAYSNVTPPTLPDYIPVTMCSYNSVGPLPDINSVWTDKETYPYAYIVDSTSLNNGTDYAGKYRLAITKTPGGSVVANGVTVTTGVGYIYYRCSPGGSSWQRTLDNNLAASVAELPSYPCIWTNTNLLWEDGSTYLAASEPVPIEPYPYSVIVFNYDLEAADWYQCHLIYSATAFTYDADNGVTNTGTTYTQVYDGDAWGDPVEDTTALSLKPGENGGIYQRIWTNHDILDGSGSVYLAANSVTPVEEPEEFPILDHINGLLMALCSRPRYVKRKPVAWLYNGVRLPDIYTVYTPEVQKTHPFAFIMEYEVNGLAHFKVAYLYVLPKVEFFKADNGNWCVSLQNGFKKTDIMVSLTGETTDPSYDGKEWPALEDVTGHGTVVTEIDWANFDVLNEDGTVYLSASDPVPVYE